MSKATSWIWKWKSLAKATVCVCVWFETIIIEMNLNYKNDENSLRWIWSMRMLSCSLRRTKINKKVWKIATLRTKDSNTKAKRLRPKGCQNIVWMTEYLGLEFCILYIDFTRMLYMESKLKQINSNMILALYM